MGVPWAWAFLLGHRLVMDVLVEEATSGGAPRAQGACVIGDECPMELWNLHCDGVSAVSGRGPVDDAPEERGYLWVLSPAGCSRRSRAARRRRRKGPAYARGCPPACARRSGSPGFTSSSLLAPALTAAVATPRRRARAEESHPRSRKALRSSADSIRWLPRSRSAATSRRRIASEILAGAQPGAAAKALRPVVRSRRA